jgi:hypothetical protein
LEIVTHVFISSCKGSQGGSGGYDGSSSGTKDGDFHCCCFSVLMMMFDVDDDIIKIMMGIVVLVKYDIIDRVGL